jgi:hypothetical protein
MELFDTWYMAVGVIFLLWAVLSISMVARPEAIYFYRYITGKESDKEVFSRSIWKILKVIIFSAICLVIICVVHEWSHR